jgi:hypothetical protein
MNRLSIMGIKEHRFRRSCNGSIPGGPPKKEHPRGGTRVLVVRPEQGNIGPLRRRMHGLPGEDIPRGRATQSRLYARSEIKKFNFILGPLRKAAVDGENCPSPIVR